MKNFPVFLLCVSLLGCTRKDPNARHEPFKKQDVDYYLLLVFDLSGSFDDKFEDAYKVLTEVMDRYFRDRPPNKDQLLMAKISGETHSLIWQGTPNDMKDKFGTVEDFKTFLRSHANGDSRVHEGLRHAIRYLMVQRPVRDGRAKSVTLVFSDMLDTSNNPATETELMGVMKTYVNSGGNMGFFFMDQGLFWHWHEQWEKAGIDFVVLEPDVHGRPLLPQFRD